MAAAVRTKSCQAVNATSLTGERSFGRTTLLANMDLAVHNFSKALRFGTKFLYQALPRLITIWLDFADKEEFKRYDPIKGNNVEAISTSK